MKQAIWRSLSWGGFRPVISQSIQTIGWVDLSIVVGGVDEVVGSSAAVGPGGFSPRLEAVEAILSILA